MNSNYTTGGYIESWCTKCELELGHTIIAMVNNLPKRVKCNTCSGDHNYRSNPSEKSRIKSKSPSRKAKAQVINYNEHLSRLTGGNFSNTRKYSINGNFKKDEVIDHSQFGIGIVLSIIQFTKMEILFKDGPKLLIQNREALAGTNDITL
jgi:hypothetical protein